MPNAKGFRFDDWQEVQLTPVSVHDTQLVRCRVEFPKTRGGSRFVVVLTEALLKALDWSAGDRVKIYVQDSKVAVIKTGDPNSVKLVGEKDGKGVKFGTAALRDRLPDFKCGNARTTHGISQSDAGPVLIFPLPDWPEVAAQRAREQQQAAEQRRKDNQRAAEQKARAAVPIEPAA